MRWLLFGFIAYVLQLAIVLALEYRRPAKAVSWLAIQLLLPLIGLALYIVMAADYPRRRKLRRGGLLPSAGGQRGAAASSSGATGDDNGPPPRIDMLLAALPGAPATGGNRVDILATAAVAYDAMLAEMEAAQEHIHLCSYIMRDDRTGRRFGDVLMRKASQGVQVRVLIDGIGSYGLPDDFIGDLKCAGVQVAAFLPATVSVARRSLNYRNHRKILVVDDRVGFTGGLNIGDEYLGLDPKYGHWRDMHLQLQGPAVGELQRIFRRDWVFAAGGGKPDKRLKGGSVRAQTGEPAGRHRAQIVADGPDAWGNPLLELFHTAIASARSRVYIVTPYLIPDAALRLALRTAAISGLDVRVVIPGLSDSKLVQWATLSYVQELLQAGIRVYRYGNGFIHSKLVLIDGEYASVGTANLDMRSLHANFELTAVLIDTALTAALEQQFWLDVSQSAELHLQSYAARPRRQRFCELAGRMLASLL